MEKPLKSKKILLVEDDVPLSQVIITAFGKKKFKIFWAKDGKEGLKMVLKERPDLILLDIIMPRMDGMEMLKAVRSNKEIKDTPVFILTNLESNEKIAQAIEDGVCGYLIKTDLKLKDLVKKAEEKLK